MFKKQGQIPLVDDLIKKFKLDQLDNDTSLIKIDELLQKINIRVPRPSYIIVEGLILLLFLTFAKFFVSISMLLVGYAMPAHMSLSLMNKDQSEENQRRVTLKYWVVFAITLFFDGYLSFILNILPFYPYTKLILYYSLWYQDYKFSQDIFGMIRELSKKVKVPHTQQPQQKQYQQYIQFPNQYVKQPQQFSNQYVQPPVYQQPTVQQRQYKMEHQTPGFQNPTQFTESADVAKAYEEFRKKNQ